MEQAVATLTERIVPIKRDTEEIIRHVRETNSRVIHLEVWQNRVIGAVGVVMFLLATFGGTLLAYLLVTA